MSRTQNITKKIQKGVNPQKEESFGTVGVLKGVTQAFKEYNDTDSTGMVIGDVHGNPSSICHLVAGTLNIEKEKHSPNSLVLGRSGVGMSFTEKAKVVRENTINTVEFKNLNPTVTEKQLFLHFGLYLVENNETIKRYAVVHTNSQCIGPADFPTTLSVELKYIEWDSGVEFFIDLEMFKIINLLGDFELLKLMEDRMRELQGEKI